MTIISSLVFIATTGIIYPYNAKAIEDIEPIEVILMRSEYEKHYDNGDGTYTAYIDTVPLHYYDNGEWLDIHNTLVQDEYGNYTNKNNAMKITLSSEASVSSIDNIAGEHNNNNKMVSIDYKGYSLSWSLIDTVVADEKPVIKDKPMLMSEMNDIYIADSIDNLEKDYPVASIALEASEENYKKVGMNKSNEKISESVSNLNSSVSYDNIYEATDCKIDIQSNAIKETLILENPDKVLEEYSYFIQSNGLVA